MKPKPFYFSRKAWTALLTLIAIVVANETGRGYLVEPLVALGMSVVVGFGLADHGKERAALEQGADRE